MGAVSSWARAPAAISSAVMVRCSLRCSCESSLSRFSLSLGVLREAEVRGRRGCGSSQREVTTLPRVKKLHALGAVGVGVAEQRALPAAEGVVGHRHRDRHVDADHADLDLVLEPAGRAAVVGEDRGAVAVRVGVDQRQPSS